MSIIDEVLSNKNIDWNDLLDGFKLSIAKPFYENHVLKQYCYKIPKYNEDLEDPGLFILESNDGFKAKSSLSMYKARGRYAGVETLKTAERIERDYGIFTCSNGIFSGLNEDFTCQDYDWIEDICFALHGNYTLTNQDVIDQYLDLKTLSNDKVKTEIDLALKNVFYYALVEDWDQFYVAMKALSHAKGNVMAKREMERPIKKSSGHYSIKVFRL